LFRQLIYDRANSSVFGDFLNSARDAEEQIASGKLFQTEVALVWKITTATAFPAG